jgi:hypothetical protein
MRPAKRSQPTRPRLRRQVKLRADAMTRVLGQAASDWASFVLATHFERDRATRLNGST